MSKLKNLIDEHWLKTSCTLKDIPEYVFKSFRNILLCRTEALGCHVYRCPECGEIVLVRHSCKDRFCVSCGTAYTDTWVAKITNMLSRILSRERCYPWRYYASGNIWSLA